MSKVLVIKGADFSENALDTVQFDVVRCTGITLDKATLSLDAIGAVATLVPTVLPSDCEESVYWTSSNTDCCTVTQNGVVTVVGVGTATVTARCGSYAATCAVSVEILATIERQKNANANPGNADNHYTNVSCYPAVPSTTYAIRNMLMFEYQDASDELIIGYSLITYADSVASLPAWDESTNGYVVRSRNAGMTNYPKPIALPSGCTKVRTETPLTGYGSRILWFKKDVRCGSSPSSGSENEKKGYFTAYRELAVTNDNYTWDYNSGETFDVPEGYDSCVVVWQSSDSAQLFRDMSDDDVAKFKMYFS